MPQTVGSENYMNSDYMEYQKKHRNSIRESDKVTIELIEKNLPAGNKLKLLDVGCHNGNLLYHINKAIPNLHLKGIDLFPGVVEGCRNDPQLSGISFEVMDVKDLHSTKADIVVVSAVMFRFNDNEYSHICHNFYRCLESGGTLVMFDLFNPFRQTLQIVEMTPTHPAGLVLNLRFQGEIEKKLVNAGFSEICFQMFEIPIDLPLVDPQDPLFTHTVRTKSDKRLQFRGSLYQPWCHLVAKKV